MMQEPEPRIVGLKPTKIGHVDKIEIGHVDRLLINVAWMLH